MSTPSNKEALEPLALVGIGCRFPGSIVDPESFWSLLIEGKSAVTEIPQNRWDANRHFSEEIEAKGKMVTKWGGFVDQLEEFDADFFSIAHREAVRMDPQQRWLLEITQEAMEDAHCPSSQLAATRTGVFLGLSNSDYSWIQGDFVEKIDGYTNSGNTPSIAANRLSFHFDFKGPSLVVDTACSSGLVAFDLACKSIQSGECNHAFAGGASNLILPHGSLGFSKAGMLSPTGKCRAFDAKADGYVRSEGAGIVLIKPYADAIRDGNRIYALIRSTTTNQDGRTSSMTVPALDAQRTMLEEALAATTILPCEVSYVEAHGTGTPVGDPIEARAIGEVISAGRSPEEACPIGSVKTNLGHLEPASGLAGLIKTALVLKHRTIPPSLHFETPNPNIPFEELRLRVVTETAPLESKSGNPPVAVVNSFGFGGTNAQAILQSPPQERNTPTKRPTIAERRPALLPLSAKSAPALKDRAEQFRTFLTDSNFPLPSICATAAKQTQFSQRLVAIGHDSESLSNALRDFEKTNDENVIAGEVSVGDSTRPLFVYTGQGSQWWGMGRDLLEREPVFRETIAKIDAFLAPLADFTLLEELRKSEQDSRIDTTSIAQPALFAIQAGLTELWRSWGIEPGGVIGHSVGEVAASVAAGIYDLKSATELVFHRSCLQQTTGGNGGMVAVGLSRDAASKRLSEEYKAVEIAVVNSPSLVTLSGNATELESLAKALEVEGIFVKFLPISFAFHSRQMDSIEEDVRESLDFLRPSEATIPFYSTVEAKRISGGFLDADYWWRNIREPVEFAATVSAAVDGGHRMFLEVGPHPSLSASILECLASERSDGKVFHSLNRDSDDSMELAQSLSRLHVAGASIDWDSYLQAEPVADLRLPQYPWQRKICWLESPRQRNQRLGSTLHPFLEKRLDGPTPAWETLLDPKKFTFLEDHTFWNRIVFPAAGFSEIAAGLARTHFTKSPHIVENLEIEQILFLGRSDTCILRVEIDPDSNRFAIHSRQSDSEFWTTHAKGRIVPRPKALNQTVNLGELRDKLPNYSSHWDTYSDFSKLGYHYGESFQQIEQVWYDKRLALARVTIPDKIFENVTDFSLHPATLDACFQVVITASIEDSEKGESPELLLPSQIGRIQVDLPSLPKRFWVRARILERTASKIVGDLSLLDDTGNQFGRIDGFTLTSVSNDTSSQFDQFLYRFAWIEKPLEPQKSSQALSQTDVVILADQAGISDEIVDQISDEAQSIEVIEAGDAATLTSAELDQLRAALDKRTTDQHTIVLHLRSLDHPTPESLNETELRRAQETGAVSLLAISKELQNSSRSISVICVSWACSGTPLPSWNPASAPLLGVLRTATNEIPHVAWKSVLLDLSRSDTAAREIVAELQYFDGESEIALLGGVRQSRRLEHARFDDFPRFATTYTQETSGDVRYRLENEKPGTLDRLAINEAPEPSLASDQVEIRVEAAGINFRDLMKLLKTYPGERQELKEVGDEFSGVVVSVGANVSRFSPGDQVVGMSKYCFQSHVVAPQHILFRKPNGISHTEAAGLPTVFLTAHYALVQLAQLRPGNSILIHAAAGGVGLAAIQIARHLKLEIFATAGSDEKRSLLTDLGIKHVMDSRSLAFADEIMEVTGGHGVDAVLNSLAGEFLLKSLAVLAPFGKFLEIGKVDIFADRKLGMSILRNNISFHAIDLGQFLAEKQEEAESLFQELGEAFESGKYKPLPCEVYPASRATEAFRKMARGEHFGKLVLDFQEPEIAVGKPSEIDRIFHRDLTYLVAGGASGFGFEIVKWFAAHGAENIVMLSRSGPRTDSILEEIEELRNAGLTIRDERVDICDLPALRSAINEIEAEMPPLSGVVHAAMVLDDRLISELDQEAFEAASSPKILGAWNLHVASDHRDLDLFICFSSIATILGSFKQANYNAGNAFMDELCQYRRAQGLPAMSIAWGALAGAGYLEREEATRNYLEAIGMETFRPDEVFSILQKLISLDAAHVAAGKINWGTTMMVAPALKKLPLYKTVVEAGTRQLSSGRFRRMILATPEEQRRSLVEEFFRIQIAEVFGTDPETLDADVPVTNLGMDSLMAIELLNRIENELGIQFPMGNILGGPSIRELIDPLLNALANSLATDTSNASENPLPNAIDEPPGITKKTDEIRP